MDFVEICRQFLSLDSSPRAGTGEAGDFIENLCLSLGLAVKRFNEESDGLLQSNLLISMQDHFLPAQTGGDFLLQAHMDTPDPGAISSWIKAGYAPFDPTIRDGFIYGLGAANVKLDLVAKIFALSDAQNHLKGEKPVEGGSLSSFRPLVLASFGAELGMIGMLKFLRKKVIKPKWALVGEPSDLNFIYAGKGYLVVDFFIPYSEEEKLYIYEHDLKDTSSTQSKFFSGQTAHSSVPHLGDNAIDKLFAFTRQLPSGISIMSVEGGVSVNTLAPSAMLEFDLAATLKDPIWPRLNALYEIIDSFKDKFIYFRDESFTPVHSTINLGKIFSTDDGIHLMASCRIVPSLPQEVYEKWIKELKAGCEAWGIDCNLRDYKKPYQTDTAGELAKVCCEIWSKDMGKTIEFQTQPNTNEASLLSRLGTECLSFGAGVRDGNIHLPSESVKIDNLLTAKEFYKLLILRSVHGISSSIS